VVGVQQWAELRREHFVGGKSIKELARSTGLSRRGPGIDAYLAGVTVAAEGWAVIDERARRTAIAHGAWVAVASFAGPTGGGFARTAGAPRSGRPMASPSPRAGQDPGRIARATLA
jgi:hypothetical protein